MTPEEHEEVVSRAEREALARTLVLILAKLGAGILMVIALFAIISSVIGSS